MNKLYITLTIAFLFLSNYAKAQWAPISTYMADYIRNNISATAINGNLLDTTNIQVISKKTLSWISNNPPNSDLTGIEYFDSLEYLFTPSSLFFLPKLPSQLKYLDINADRLSSIGILPESLHTLKIDISAYHSIVLDSIKSIPVGLKELYISDFTGSFIAPIPTDLEIIDISKSSGIKSLPSLLFAKSIIANNSGVGSIGVLPTSMYILDVSHTPLQTMYNLPDTIETLNLSYTPVNLFRNDPILINVLYLDSCPGIDVGDFLGKLDYERSVFQGVIISATRNGLTQFPIFGTIIYSLDLSYNQFSYFDLLDQGNAVDEFGAHHPFDKMVYLNLSNSQLLSVPENLWRFNIKEVILNGNNITNLNLDRLPESRKLDLSNCNISTTSTQWSRTLIGDTIDLRGNHLDCIPPINSNVTTLFVSGNPVYCLTNIPSSNFTCIPQLPVCQIPCNSGDAQIKGSVFLDDNQNGIRDTAELPCRGLPVFLSPDHYTQQTDSQGNFIFPCQPGGPYSLSIFLLSKYFKVSTPPINGSIPNIAYGVVDSGHHIGIYAPKINDIEVKITPESSPRPGFPLSYKVTLTNLGSTWQNGFVAFHFDPRLIFLSATSGGNNTGDSVVWNFTNMQPLSGLSYDVIFQVPASTALGTLISSITIAHGNIPDTTVYNNRDSICQMVIGSYDPNDKTTYPGAGLTKEQMMSGEGIDYVVRFQNTGTASAIHVWIEDTISPLMEAATIRMIASSHVHEWRIDSGHVLKVFFNNINLPDSGADEQLSRGFFRYSIKPKAGVNIGDSIKNTALIYFDFNAPIVTNTVKTDVTTLFATPIAAQTVCEGQPLTLSFTDHPAIDKIEWLRNDTALRVYGATLQIPNTTIADNGLYSVRIILNNDAEFFSSKASIAVHTGPATPVITQSGSTLTTDATQGIQWLLDGHAVQGANSPSYTAEANGVYSVLVTDNEGCTALSDTVGMRVLSLGSADISDIISVYPNPFSSKVTLQLGAPISTGEWSFKLADVSGRAIRQAAVFQNTTILDLGQLAAGAYILHVQGNNGSSTFRLVKY